MFNNAGRLRVNMGNIYFKLGQYAKAIKFYRMALDQVSANYREKGRELQINVCDLYLGGQHAQEHAGQDNAQHRHTLRPDGTGKLIIYRGYRM